MAARSSSGLSRFLRRRRHGSRVETDAQDAVNLLGIGFQCLGGTGDREDVLVGVVTDLEIVKRHGAARVELDVVGIALFDNLYLIDLVNSVDLNNGCTLQKVTSFP